MHTYISMYMFACIRIYHCIRLYAYVYIYLYVCMTCIRLYQCICLRDVSTDARGRLKGNYIYYSVTVRVIVWVLGLVLVLGLVCKTVGATMPQNQQKQK